jgi:hypothetical protein
MQPWRRLSRRFFKRWGIRSGHLPRCWRGRDEVNPVGTQVRKVQRMLLLWIAAIVPLSGCNPLVLFADWVGPTLTVPMNPTPPIDHLSHTLGLHFTNEFTNYRWGSFSGFAKSELKYDLGRASRSLFQDTFTPLSKGVVLVAHRPPFRPEERVDAALVVEPAILAFSENHSAWLRRATYTAHIEYTLAVFDPAGKVLMHKVVRADGEYQGGAHTPGRNYAGAAEAAMRSAIVSIVNEVVSLEVPGYR